MYHRMTLMHRGCMASARAFSSSVTAQTVSRSPGMIRSTSAGAIPEAATSDAQATGSETARKKRVLSGVQPTGSVHLGNYLGAIRNWVDLQDTYDTYFMVVDLHAITVQPHNPKELLEATRNGAALYIACGIDPAKSKVFVQSHVTAHAEMAWLLSCVTPVGWLKKMIQFKEKSRKNNEEVGTGLLTYPVLMAADILLYQSDLVPVGEDQKQHLELARDLAERTNHLFGGKKAKKMGCQYTRLFKVPDPFIPPAGARVMSLQDGTSKMSKSAESDLSRINLLDSPELIQSKIKKAKTDTFDGLADGFENPDRPDAKNLLTIYQCVTGKTQDDVVADVGRLRWGEFKPVLTDALIEHLRPIQARYQDVMEDQAYLDQVLKEGQLAADEEARKTLGNVKKAMGFYVL